MSRSVGYTVSAIVLAAGRGERLGRPKALLELAGRRLIEIQISRLLEIGFSPVVAVINRDVRDALSALPVTGSPVPYVLNPDPDTGPLQSIRLGLEALNETGTATLLFPVDHPFVSDSTLRLLLERAAADRILIPAFEGRRGHPAVFGRELLPLLFQVPLEEGARGVYRRAPEAVVRLETGDPGVVLNANTPEEWARGLELVGTQ